MRCKVVKSLMNSGVKKKSIRIIKRRDKEELNNKNLSILFGTIWGIEDKSVPFDYHRKPEKIKNSLRPCVVLSTPTSFSDSSFVSVAPGTSKIHSANDESKFCFVAEVPPESLEKTTYFLLYFRWYEIQKKLQKKLCELTIESKTKLERLIEGL